MAVNGFASLNALSSTFVQENGRCFCVRAVRGLITVLRLSRMAIGSWPFRGSVGGLPCFSV